MLVAGILAGYWLRLSSSVTGHQEQPGSRAVDLTKAGSELRGTQANHEAAASKEERLSESTIATMDLNELKKAADGWITMSDAAERRRMEGLIFGRWAKLDLAGAWAEAMSRATRRSEFGPALAVLGVIAATDPIGGLKRTMELPASVDRGRAVEVVLGAWAARSPDEAWAYLMQHDDLPGFWNAPDAVLQQIATKDPARAVKLGATLTNNTMRENSLIHFLPAWVATDADAALSWAQNQADPMLRDHAVRYAYEALAGKNPSMAADLASQITDTNARRNAYNGVFESWLRQDLNSALAKISRLGGDVPSGIVINYFANKADKMTNEELLAAGRPLTGELLRNFQTSAVRNRAMRGQYMSAVSLINELPDEETRLQAVKDLAQSWSSGAPETFMSWLEKWPPSKDRDEAISSGLHWFPSANARPDRELAIAVTISDPTIRETKLASILATWSFQSFANAEAWIQGSNGLSPAAKAKLLESVQAYRARMRAH